MKKSMHYFLLVVLTIISSLELPGQESNDSLTGAYLGQEKPGLQPTIFAPNIVSKKGEYEFGSVFSNDGNEFYYGVDVGGKSEIRTIIYEDNQWSTSKRLNFNSTFSYNDPFLSSNGDKLYFISDRPLDNSNSKKDIDIWYAKREGKSWSEPINAGEMINSPKNEYYISFTKNATMYFSSNVGTTASTNNNFDIYYAEFKAGAYQQPVKLNENINSSGYEADVYISPDERYIIFCAIRESGLGEGDLYISFKKNGEWTKAKNMGDKINTKGHELCPFVTSDGKFLFYTSNKDIYWVDAAIIESYDN